MKIDLLLLHVFIASYITGNILENASANDPDEILQSSSTGIKIITSGPPPVRYPDPAVVTLDPRFDKYRQGNVAVERL